MPDEMTDEPVSGTDTSVDTQDTDAEPKLYFGKYKSLEEAEKAFKESEQKMHEATTRASEAERRAQEWQNYYQSTDQRGDASKVEYEETMDEYVNRADVRQESTQVIQQFFNLHRQSQANIEESLDLLKSERNFGKVAGKVKAELLRLDPSITANANIAKDVSKRLYHQALGEYYSNATETARADPRARRQFLDEIGIQEPSPAGGQDNTEITSDERDVLEQLGVSKEGFKRIQERRRNQEVS